MLPEGWKRQTVADICEMQNGHGFGPNDWGVEGLPIIRIQNLNGGQKFDFYAGPTEPRWIVDPGQLLFAWAGSKGVSFGPTIWRGKRGVLNQHIFKVHANAGIDSAWLYWALRYVTDRIEANAHGFKATLVHVKKSDIDRQSVIVPDQGTQTRIAEVMQTWDDAIVATEKLLANSRKRMQALTQCFLSDRARMQLGIPKLQRKHADEVFSPHSVRRNDGLELLSVMQDVGIVPRSSLDRKVVMPEGSTDSYKLVEPGDFVISLRSFEGGLEYSRYKGLVSPAYTVLKPKTKIVDDFYRHYFKSREFIGRLSVAVIGIRDGKQISYDDFAFLRIPAPPIKEQARIADILNTAEASIRKHEIALEKLRAEKFALMQQLLTGKRRVRVPASEAAP